MGSAITWETRGGSGVGPAVSMYCLVKMSGRSAISIRIRRGAEEQLARPGRIRSRHERGHRGRIEIEFGDGATHLLDPGGAARVDPATVRRIRNVGDHDAIYLIVGAQGGYVGRDGKLPEGETSRFGPAGPPGAEAAADS